MLAFPVPRVLRQFNVVNRPVEQGDIRSQVEPTIELSTTDFPHERKPMCRADQIRHIRLIPQAHNTAFAHDGHLHCAVFVEPELVVRLSSLVCHTHHRDGCIELRLAEEIEVSLALWQRLC